MREWVVASALVERDGELLLVLNRRRGGGTDWSTPGGVIDATDSSVIAGLTREVEVEDRGLGPSHRSYSTVPWRTSMSSRLDPRTA